MASARYWRVVGVRAHGSGDLHLTEFQMWSALARVDLTAAVSATVPPTAGSVSLLSDGNTTNAAVWPVGLYSAPGFSLVWDFAAATTVDGFKFGTGSSKDVSLRQCDLDYSTDGISWTRSNNGVIGALPYSDQNTLESCLPSASGFQHWAVNVKSWVYNGSPNGGGLVRIAELQLFAGATKYPAANMLGPNTPAPYVATATTAYAGNPAYQAFDGVISDAGRWMSADSYTGPQRLQIDLGAVAAISEIRLAPDGAVYAGAGYYITSFDVEGSPSGAFTGEQTVVGSFSGLTQAAWTPNTLSTFTLGSAYPVTPIPVESTSLAATRFANSPIPAFGGGRDLGTFARVRNFETDGNGVISGTVAILGDPTNTLVRRRVRLLRDKDAVLVAEVWSNATTGAFSFPAIDRTQKYIVLTDDYEASYRAVVADRITPELMP